MTFPLQDRTSLLHLSHVHRGGGKYERPDNTLDTFRWCWENGSALECDCRRTRDGVGIMLHDATLRRTARGIPDTLADKDVSSELDWADVRDIDVGSYLSPARLVSQAPRGRVPRTRHSRLLHSLFRRRCRRGLLQAFRPRLRRLFLGLSKRHVLRHPEAQGHFASRHMTVVQSSAWNAFSTLPGRAIRPSTICFRQQIDCQALCRSSARSNTSLSTRNGSAERRPRCSRCATKSTPAASASRCTARSRRRKAFPTPKRLGTPNVKEIVHKWQIRNCSQIANPNETDAPFD